MNILDKISDFIKYDEDLTKELGGILVLVVLYIASFFGPAGRMIILFGCVGVWAITLSVLLVCSHIESKKYKTRVYTPKRRYGPLPPDHHPNDNSGWRDD